MFLAAIEVEFEPHWADERMLWFTAGSIVITGVLGWLAYWNGRKAGKIAKEASKREEERIKQESIRRIAKERADAAFAMLKALNAVSDYIDTVPWHQRDISRETAKALPSAYVDTYTRLDIFEFQNEEPGLRVWFESALVNLLRIAHAHDEAPQLAEEPIKVIRATILRWHSKGLKSSELGSVNLRWPSRADIL